VFISSQLALEYSVEVQDIPGPPLSVPPTITEEETQVRQNIMFKSNAPNAKIIYYNIYAICVGVQESGHIQIVHVEEDVLRKSGATLMTVEQSTPEQRLTWISEKSIHIPTETQV